MYAILVWVFVSLSFPLVLFAETRVPLNSNEISLSFAPVVKRAAPAVVNIYAKRLVNQSTSPFQNDPDTLDNLVLVLFLDKTNQFLRKFAHL